MASDGEQVKAVTGAVRGIQHHVSLLLLFLLLLLAARPPPPRACCRRLATVTAGRQQLGLLHRVQRSRHGCCSPRRRRHHTVSGKQLRRGEVADALVSQPQRALHRRVQLPQRFVGRFAQRRRYLCLVVRRRPAAPRPSLRRLAACRLNNLDLR